MGWRRTVPRGPAGLQDEFWTVTDGGPNGQIKVDGTNRMTFPVPGSEGLAQLPACSGPLGG
jgi:hypothetical protein